MPERIRIGLIGNPNCGKTTLFNALTGHHQRVGNWPGVTVERKVGGYVISKDLQVSIIDLPGTYSLSVLFESTALDERIAVEYLLSNKSDLLINVVDASNLERNLYLTTQLLELGTPVIVALNMTDVAKKRGIKIDIDLLSKSLGCPVIPVVSSKKHGLKLLRETILTTYQDKPRCKSPLVYAEPVRHAIEKLSQTFHEQTPDKHHHYFLSIRLLEDDTLAKQQVTEASRKLAEQLQAEIAETLNEDIDILIADARYQFIHQIIQSVIKKSKTIKTITHIIDQIVLNRILGIPIFLCMMYLMFLFAINIGGAFQDFFNIGGNAIFVHGTMHLLTTWHFPGWLIAIIAAGVGKGINTTLTFIPVIGAMFLFLTFLEDSGYMARAAFVVDRIMNAIGLPGKAFIPMIVGFGCNVPAVMASRTLENRRDRILTVMMTPFMSCSARLAIFAVFVAAFFPTGGQNIVFLLYIIGIFVAILTGFILQKTLLKGSHSALVLELPSYHLPTTRSLFTQTWHRLKCFILKAGKIIIPACFVLGALNAIGTNFKLIEYHHSKHSILSKVGQTITPIFSPMGFQQNNWPATVGLISGTLAKEVVIGTLNTLYTQDAIKPKQSRQSITEELKKAVNTIPMNFANFGKNFKNPIVANAPHQEFHEHVYGIMYQKFNGKIGAFAYLLFILLYMPCIATIAAIKKELGAKWMLFSIGWSTGLAYMVSTSFYQIASFTNHMTFSSIWLIIMLLIIGCTIYLFQRIGRRRSS